MRLGLAYPLHATGRDVPRSFSSLGEPLRPTRENVRAMMIDLIAGLRRRPGCAASGLRSSRSSSPGRSPLWAVAALREKKNFGAHLVQWRAADTPIQGASVLPITWRAFH